MGPTNDRRALLADPAVFERGINHVAAVDPRIRNLVRRHGIIQFRPVGRPFDSVVQSILSQQLNGKAADAIITKTYRLFLPGRPTPDKMVAIPRARLRRAGVSPQKVEYLKDLAKRMTRGRLDFARFAGMDDEEIVLAMDEVKGVGRWTAQMFLIFSLGRPDVLPVDDFGIKAAVKNVYGLRQFPKPDKIERIARPWHPFSTVASLYLWRSREVV